MPKQLFDGSRPGPGRPKGSRNKLSENFLRDVYDLWQAKGRDMLERVADEDPAKLVQVVANLLPKEMKIESRRLEALTTDELIAILREEGDSADDAAALH
ncbi:hypothetical protein WDZ92_29860 [Nostoc sp. NIES-2111]